MMDMRVFYSLGANHMHGMHALLFLGKKCFCRKLIQTDQPTVSSRISICRSKMADTIAPEHPVAAGQDLALVSSFGPDFPS